MLQDINANSFLILLILMQIAMLTFSLLGQFSLGVYFVGMRILFLIVAQCCKRPRSAAFYSVLALMNAFYSFDPVGLFVTGHGQTRTLAANIFCIIACGLAFLTSYLGYHYKVALESENPEGENVDNNPTFMYGGSGTGYINPNDRQNRNPYSSAAANRSFQPFQGEGHSIG